jgi:hypothetical protein
VSHVKYILNQQPPDTLYHYTNQQGLLGILKSKEIWATHTQYLNDSREFSHAIELANRRLGLMIFGAPRAHKNSLKEMQEAIREGIENTNVCVCSFSTAGDRLSQWRAYAGGAGGFSIGFSGAFLKDVSHRENVWLVPCVYDEVEQERIVEKLLKDVLDELGQRGRRHSGTKGGRLIEYLSRYAPVLKHKSFEEEEEWRLISRPLMSSDERLDYRQGSSMLVPYYRVPLSAHGQPLSLKEIIIGPTPHRTQSRRSVENILAKHGLQITQVHNTAGPFRSW